VVAAVPICPPRKVIPLKNKVTLLTIACAVSAPFHFLPARPIQTALAQESGMEDTNPETLLTEMISAYQQQQDYYSWCNMMISATDMTKMGTLALNGYVIGYRKQERKLTIHTTRGPTNSCSKMGPCISPHRKILMSHRFS